jgi:hypothetical protein
MKKRIKDLTKEEIERLPNKNFITITNYEGRKMRIIKPFILNSLYGTIDIPDKHILDKQEHDYLRAVIKPYKVKYIKKTGTEMFKQFIEIVVESSLYYCATESWSFPFFKPNSMYKGMEVNKKYTLEELELDKEWNND